MLHKHGGSSERLTESEIDIQFCFPQAESFKPPDPPSPYTSEKLDTTYNQAIQLWPLITRQSCANALSSHYADGDPTKAIVLLQFYLDAAEGYVTSVYKRNGSFLALRGAVNYGGISCYADSLLVAMFSRMENFEPLLFKKRYEDKATDRLATWLRLFVNLLRNGERITDDIVEALLATAVAAGWAGDSNPLGQQDAAEFFVFITEKLKMPLLALRVDIAHAGKEVEEYDHKLIREQLLYLPIPGTSRDPPILLEECLEVYFSNAINVSRHLAQPSVSNVVFPPAGAFHVPPSPGSVSFVRQNSHDSSTQAQQSPQLGKSRGRHRSYSILSLTTNSSRRFARGLSTDETLPSPSTTNSASKNNQTASGQVPSGNSIGEATGAGSQVASNSAQNTQSPYLTRSATPDDLFDPLDTSSEVMLSSPEPGSRHGSEQPLEHQPTPPQPGSLPSYHQLFGFNEDKQAEARVRDMKHSIWTSNNEIMLPAWMFLQLMPFYADIHQEKSNLENLEAEEVANHFRRTRPVLGFCLKRYFVDEQGHPQRNDRSVIVPEEITMPSFVADDSDQKQAFGSFKLVLESAIFHRGESIHSGHYLALIAEDVFKNRKTSNQSAGSFESARTSLSTNQVYTSSSDVFVEGASSNADLSSSLASKPLSFSSGAAFMPTKKWYLYDDLQTGGERIKEVSYKDVFDKDVPYMLFYRMVSLEEGQESRYDTFTPSASSTGLSTHPQFESQPSSIIDFPSRVPSRVPSPELVKDKKKKGKFFRRHRDKDKTRDYANKYREEKCTVM